MAKTLRKTDKVRASRDGHEYHEAWTARKAMQLLLGDDHLVGIAVEGLDPIDQTRATPETVEVADLTLYYGQGTGFENADGVAVVQSKYSPSQESAEFRASDAKKTIAKFAASYRNYMKLYGAQEVEKKLRFQLITNRPIYPYLTQAIRELAAGRRPPGEAGKQAQQFEVATGLKGKALAAFAGKCQISGKSGSLIDSKRGLAMLLIDWSATADAIATARLGEMRDMVRDKAGHAGTDQNVIRYTDVLAALKIPDRDALLPCPAALADVGTVVQREQLPDAIALVPTLHEPLLIHAAGGVGKTVFMNSLAKAFQDSYEIVLFDCFGGGAYRSPEDARHLPKRGLIHIANSLACRGLCDPMLPDSDDLVTLLKTFRRRLEQCVRTLSTVSPKKQLLILLDAIDNAAEHARDTSEVSFPTRLLEGLQHEPIHGVTFVASSRSHRIPIKDIQYRDFELRPFSSTETATYLRGRLPKVTELEIRVAQARSGGNPRILEYLVKSKAGLLDPSEIGNRLQLDDLIIGRLERALSEARKRGYRQKDINAFLAGLAVLPPPVPLDEYAEAHGMELSAIESFVADLAPLLERTKHGLMFRDEPTETLVRDKYGSMMQTLQSLASNLLARQDRSVYAARALPRLLQLMGDGKQLFNLAFDDRFPAAITSTVGKRNIRYARLRAAVRYAANRQDHDQLVHLLLELSTIATVDHRGASYILASPDLVIAAQDVDATRRLFETPTSWPGTRHARLAIAHTLSGDLNEASRHAHRANDWLDHYRQRDRDKGVRDEGPESLDVAAIPFFMIADKRHDLAVRFMRRWKDWYAYEVGEHLFGLLDQRQTGSGNATEISRFIGGLTKEIGCISSALSSIELTRSQQKILIAKLRHACWKTTTDDTHDEFYRKRHYSLQDGLRKASVIAASHRLHSEAAVIAGRVPHERPAVWYFRDNYRDERVFPFLFHVALTAAIKGVAVREKDLVPTELVPFCDRMKPGLSGAEFQKELKRRLANPLRARASREAGDVSKKTLSYESKRDVEEYLDRRLAPLLDLTKTLSAFLRAAGGKADSPFQCLLTAWADARSRGGYYGKWKHDPFFQILGCQMAAFALWARSDLGIDSVKMFLGQLHEQEVVSPATLIQLVAIMAKRKSLQGLAGEEAIRTRSKIETEREVGYKASLYAELARAILPASIDEAIAYFRAGLDQVNAIGSGDYEFTNELLLFASSLRGRELEDRDFHTLANICELNLTDETEKFPWFACGKAMAGVSGCKGIARLGRWDDRSTVSLGYTLMPYLIALLDAGKLAPEDGLALNRLADPAEFYSCNTETLAEAIAGKHHRHTDALVIELIMQFEENNPGVSMVSTLKTLAGIAATVLGRSASLTKLLLKRHRHFVIVQEGQSDHTAFHSGTRGRLGATQDDQNAAELRKILRRTKPFDEPSLSQAIADIEKIGNLYSLKGSLFDGLRLKVQFNQRGRYLRALSGLENLNLYAKLEELKTCRKLWANSSAALTGEYKSLALPLLRLHTDDMLSQGHLSTSLLKDIAELSGTSIATLAVDLITLYAEADSGVPAAVWLNLASVICDESGEGVGQAALERLLNSEAATLSSTVVEGEWKNGAYPTGDVLGVLAGITWRMLGSPIAADRWRAAHSVRRFAKFGRWNIIDALVDMLDREDAGPFQAPELCFYYMHARLWLLIALARVSIDHPDAIAKHKDALLNVVRDKYGPHVVMRHFAARALTTCLDAKTVTLPGETEALVRAVDFSPRPRLRKKLKDGDDLYRARPATSPKPKSQFTLDYDFHKYYVQSLSTVFGRPGWEVTDCLSDIVRGIDPNVTSMYESGGREIGFGHGTQRMASSTHTYGQQLGWHALQLTAGKLLQKYPVTEDSFCDKPWNKWLAGFTLTRSDGLWLADGVDQVPLEVACNLLERRDKGRVITGDKTTLLRLASIRPSVSNQFCVSGSWNSADLVHVRVSSVLVAPRKASCLAKALISEEPMHVWVPEYDEYDAGGNFLRSKKPDCVPWIVRPSGEEALDADDPLGSVLAMRRPRIASSFASVLGLMPGDPFYRVWLNQQRRVVACAEAWGREKKNSEDPTVSGTRLLCSRGLLKRILAVNNSDLLILLVLQRYEKGPPPHSKATFTHTIAVIRVTKSLEVKYYKGRINHLHESKF